MKSVQANNPYLIEIFERNTEEWINCLTADEAAKQKLAIVVEHAGKLSSNWGLQRRFRQLSSKIGCCWRVFRIAFERFWFVS
jgi:hypothetical protein